MKATGKDLQYFDPETKEKYTPYVIEPAAGVDRTALTFLIDCYREGGDRRTTKNAGGACACVRALAPIKIAVLPLLAPKSWTKCHALKDRLKARWRTVYDKTASIGKLYRRQDEIGTPGV